MNIDMTAIEKFFQVLHRYNNLEADQGFFLSTKKTLWENASDIDAVIEKAAALASNNEIWFNTVLHSKEEAKEDYLKRHPDRDSRYARGTENSAKVVFGAFLDIDVQGPGHAENNLPASKELAIEFLNSLSLKITMIIDSGGGIHAYILFDKPFNIENDNDRKRIKKLLSGIQKIVINGGRKKGWNLDFVGDIARMGRIPGTFNLKIPDNPRQVKMISCEEGNRYTVEELEMISNVKEETIAENNSLQGEDFEIHE